MQRVDRGLMNKCAFYWLIGLFLCGIVPHAAAQNNYWTQQFSSYTMLTGGTGMSNSRDNSVFYYNPGAVGFIDTSSINISANLYAYDRVKLKNGAGQGLDLVSNKMNVHAQVLAGNLYFRKASRFRFVYGYMMRNFSRFEFEQQVTRDGDFMPVAPGNEYYSGKFDYTFSNGEYWGGIGVGYKINEHISVGLGHYGGFITTKNTYFQNISVDAINPDSVPYVASVDQRLKYQLDHFYILFKPGIDLRFGRHKIGLASMLPSVRIWGKGKMYQSIEVSNLHFYNTDSSNVFGIYPNLVVQGDQKKVRTVIRQAPSISLGYEYENPKFRAAVMLEYFFRVRPYDLIYSDKPVYVRPEEAYNQQVVPNFMRIRSGAYGVLNIGVGFDRQITRKIRLLTGFRTDFNNQIPMFRKTYEDYVTSVNPQFWNYMHFSVGISIQNDNRRTYIGLIYKYGYSNYHKNFANMGEPSFDNFFLGSAANNMVVDIHGVGITLGYSIFSRVDKVFQPFAEPRSKKKRRQ